MKKKHKSRIFFVIFLVLVGLVFFYLSIQRRDFLSSEEKDQLIGYSYSVLDGYFNNNSDYIVPQIKNDEFEKIFISLYNKGNLRCSYSGLSDDLVEHVKEALINCIEDERFGGALEYEELQDIRISFDFLMNKQLIGRGYDNLKSNIELGIHALEVSDGEKKAFFKSSVPITKNYGLMTTLQRLCEKAGFQSNCFAIQGISFYKYDTFSFAARRDKSIIDLYRYHTIVHELNNEALNQSLNLANEWFLNNRMYNARQNYEYLPSKDSYSDDNNDLRHLATVWAISELSLFLKNDSNDNTINSTLDYYLAYEKERDHYLIINKSGANIALNAFIIMTLLNIDPENEKISKLADGILAIQKPDGSFKTYFESDSDSGIDFYPGEAMLSLMKVYKKTNDKKYMQAVERAFTFYRSYWRNNKNTAFIPWHTQTYKLLYEETKNKELSQFIFEMNDWLIDNHQVIESPYEDLIGSFPKEYPKSSTYAYLEGINDAYAVAVLSQDQSHSIKYKESLEIGTKYMLQNQYNFENSFYLENPKRAIGGFKYSVINNGQRIDYTQHAVMAILKSMYYEVFR